ncbi:D-sedoheptulose 7-phosphate isomerase [candidate division KSB1 bacterium]|nr:D-sedoheptulose 7-phosphate isomerase [candidate division KSB1 bacterium]
MDERIAYIHSQLSETIDLLREIDTNLKKSILRIADVFGTCLSRGGKVLICGNGGSAADAQHFAAELVGRLSRNRQPFAALALTTDTSILTALSNDFSFDLIFQRQLEALGLAGDVLMGISTSGNSKNVIQAILAAKEKGITTVGLTGKGGGELANVADEILIVPHDNAQHIQEAHVAIMHIWCALIEAALLPE